MAERKPQNFANHTRLDPSFHFVLIGIILITLILAIVNLVRHYDTLPAWILLLLTMAVLIAGFLARTYSLKAQDRVIRLEERLRLSVLLPEPLRSRIDDLTEPQLIALRFAPDTEVPVLVQKTLTENLKSPDIKKAIRNWRPDYFRI